MEAFDSSSRSENATVEQQCTASERALSIVFIDPDNERASSICHKLTHVGFTAAVASDSATAIRLIDIHKPDIVLLESMPSAEGIPLCQAIKQMAPDVIVLLYTGQPQAWQISAEFIAGVVPPCAHFQELVEEICASLMHRKVSRGQHEMRDRLAWL